jgi:hypothetical protein
MCTDSKQAMHELIVHIEQAAEILEGRMQLFNSKFGARLPRQAAEAHAQVSYDCNFLVRAVSLLRPLVERGNTQPHQT